MESFQLSTSSRDFFLALAEAAMPPSQRLPGSLPLISYNLIKTDDLISDKISS